MGAKLGVLLMMNNYLHDVATALLVTSGFVLWSMMRLLESAPAPQAGHYFLALYRRMTRLALFSLAWIVVGGVPRLLTYEAFEWANAAGKSQVPALLAKHVVAFSLVGGGVWVWRRLRRRAVELRAALATDVDHGPGATEGIE